MPDQLDGSDCRAAFSAEVRAATRSTGRVVGLIALVAFPLWSVFDYVVAPEHADGFLKLRLLFVVPMLACWLALLGPLGRRRPEWLVLGVMACVEVAQAAAYATGMALPIAGAAFLLTWSWRWTGALAVVGLATPATAALLMPDRPTAATLATVGFYFGTVALLGCVAQARRERLTFREFRSRTELERQQARNAELVEELGRLSLEDPLTGLANRRAWDTALAREVEQARERNTHLAVLLWDIDHFKAVNDRLGHAVGDAVLVAAAQALREAAGTGPVVARLGGDEFAVLCPGADAGGAAGLAAHLCQSFEHVTDCDPALPLVRCSIGEASARGQACSASDLMLRADQRLYQVKRARPAEAEREDAAL